MSELSVGILTRSGSPTAAESALSNTLGLPLIDSEELAPGNPEFYLCYAETGLSLNVNDARTSGAVVVDFDSKKLTRRAGDRLRQQNLIKAVGLKKRQTLRVLDATAGLGSDGFLLARAGCEVRLLERNTVVHALLEDGMQRALKGSRSPATRDAVSRMQLTRADFNQAAAQLGSYQVIYIDPMYPLRHKSAKSKKSMQLLQRLLGETADVSGILELALHKATERVVVKRAKQSPSHAGLSPDVSFKGSSSRFDVYLIAGIL
ncbi:MAG: class I SAM-dependent methyltransferase [Gammaproteobacteria bacterium]|nr:class I SAM-dependent methyltransferase [Gammaproteobacteria bacterium]